jgi:cytochrome c-type biogenesis protein CcmH
MTSCMRWARHALLVVLLAASGIAAAAVEPLEFRDAAEEARYKALIGELRCLVCQNQSLADSNADLAGDLRHEVFNKMRSGASDKEIIDFLVARYSDFVLYRPPVKSTTFVLWFLPFGLIAGGGALLIYVIRRRRPAAEAPLSDAERARAQTLLDSTKSQDRSHS